jgi:hypothetical protein
MCADMCRKDGGVRIFPLNIDSKKFEFRERATILQHYKRNAASESEKETFEGFQYHRVKRKALRCGDLCCCFQAITLSNLHELRESQILCVM